MRIKTKWNYNHKKDTTPHKVRGVSMTIEGESFTIIELMERTRNGLLDSSNMHPGFYDEDPDHDSIDFNQVKDMDLVDKQEILEEQVEIDLENARKKKTETKKKGAIKERTSDTNEVEVEEENEQEEETEKSEDK